MTTRGVAGLLSPLHTQFDEAFSSFRVTGGVLLLSVALLAFLVLFFGGLSGFWASLLAVVAGMFTIGLIFDNLITPCFVFWWKGKIYELVARSALDEVRNHEAVIGEYDWKVDDARKIYIDCIKRGVADSSKKASPMPRDSASTPSDARKESLESTTEPEPHLGGPPVNTTHQKFADEARSNATNKNSMADRRSADSTGINPFSRPIAQATKKIRSIDWVFPYLPPLIESAVLLLVIVVMGALYSTIGIASQIEGTLHGLLISARKEIQDGTLVEKSAYAVAAGVYVIFWLPFFILLSPFRVLGWLWRNPVFGGITVLLAIGIGLYLAVGTDFDVSHWMETLQKAVVPERSLPDN